MMLQIPRFDRIPKLRVRGVLSDSTPDLRFERVTAG